ncbi:unnamed protein product [Brachionus calyciflorus]|uniref:EGF-like domain-containing protein n=1 Tax=Brachionus calyciflorus TaxID=104777 RepID=A0A814CPA9_9BILA|nr:unnamed protein product [Brachionus calyciflorus]
MIIRILVCTLLITGYLNALVSNDPCAKLKCKKPDVPCLEKSGSSTNCKCAKSCNTKNSEESKSIVTSKFGNITLKFDSRVVPLAKQGGVSCYQSACMNGGTCYTNYNAYTTPVTTTTTTTTSSPIPPPLCSCQAQFYGSRCELYNSGGSQVQEGWNNLCRVYNDKNMNVCQNGGQCVYISDNKVACVCPSTFVGQYCEIPVYEQCTGPAQGQCHREHGTCLPSGECKCEPNYGGPKCENRISTTVQVYTTQPTQAPTQACLSYYCQNGGTCRPMNVDPYVACICPPNFTGQRCEIYIAPQTLPTVPPTQPPTQPTLPPSPCQTQQYCLNGGTCEPSAYQPYAYCLCPLNFSGTRCEIYVPPQTFPTQPPTLPPTQPPAPVSPCQSQNYCVNGGTCRPTNYSPYAICICLPNYTGSRCEICIGLPPSLPTQPPTQPPAPVSPCLTQQYCLNGGTCRATNYSPYAICICSPNYTGSKCEIYIAPPVTMPTPPPTPVSPCQTSQYCLNGGSCRATNYSPYAICICPPNFTGVRCEICISAPAPATPAPVIPTCSSSNCQNGGTCQSNNPYTYCSCPPNYTGSRCEICIGGPNFVAPVTSMPRCNFTVTVKNDGAYNARFKLLYTIDGITQPILVSNVIPLGGSTSLTIPHFSKDLIVITERQSFSWNTMFTDSGIDIATKCTKCYKVWGTLIGSPQWDHVLC